MIHELFNTSITLTPGTYSTGNRSAMYHQKMNESTSMIPALITSEDEGYIQIDEDIEIKRGDVILDETTKNQFTVQDVFPMRDLYKLELVKKNV